MKACGAEAIAPAVGPTGSPGERTAEDPADEFKQGLTVNDFQEPGRGGGRERPRPPYLAGTPLEQCDARPDDRHWCRRDLFIGGRVLIQRVVRVTGPAQMAAHGGNKPFAVFNFGVVLSRETGIVCASPMRIVSALRPEQRKRRSMIGWSCSASAEGCRFI
jgi:hypothetical protein